MIYVVNLTSLVSGEQEIPFFSIEAAWREEHDIPGTDSLLELMQAEEIQKRGRSDTVSTVLSDSHDQKPEYILYQSK